MEEVGKSSEKMGEALKGFIDFHCHILPALDDGPASINESIEMARVLSYLGFNEIYCTPHLIKGVFDNHKERIEKAVLDLETTLDKNKIAVTLHAAIEYCLDEFLLDALDQPMHLGENIVLVEASRQVQPQFFAETLYKMIVLKRLRPLIAHPERYDMFDAILPERRKQGFSGLWPWNWKSLPLIDRREHSFHDDSETLDSLRSMGCLFQGNIGSFAGIYGERVKRRAIGMLNMGLYDRLGTDAHRPKKLAQWIEKGLRVIEQETGNEELIKLISMPAGQLVG